jgi:hypothetical protein
MKIAILIGAALLGATGVAAAPADAQRHGWNDRYDRGDRYDRDDRGWRDDRRSYRHDGGHRHWNRGEHRGWNRGWGRDRSRVVCRTHRGYYGPVRRCFRIHR